MKFAIKLGMSEFLLLYSAFMFDKSWNFACIAFVLGVIGACIDNMVEYGSDKNKVSLEKK